MKSFLWNFTVFILIISGSNICAQEWSTPIRISDFANGHRPKILVSGDTVHAAYENHSYSSPRIRYVRSTDDGESWDISQLISDTLDECISTHTQIIKHGSKLMVFWRAGFYGNPPNVNVGHNISTDNGLTWSVPSYILASNWVYSFHIHSSNAGPIINMELLTMLSGDSVCIYNVRSTDFGESWSEPVAIFRPRSISGSGDQVSDRNYVHLVWTGSIEGGFPKKPYYMKSTDAGLTWSQNVELGECDVSSQHAAISANGKGDVGVLWIGENNNVNLRISHDFGDTWDPAIEITSNNTARETCDIQLTGNAILTCWEDYRFDPDLGAIYFKKSLDGGQSWDDEYYVDRNSDHSWDPSLTGNVKRHYMIWYDDRSVGGPGIYFSRWPGEITSVEDEGEELPEKISLYAYPNPFNSSTTITYHGLASGYIGIYDIKGRLVKRLQLSDRTGSITWDAYSDNGINVSSGIYFVRPIDFNRNNQKCIKLIYIK
jgi:hypothetical protein